VLIVCLRGSWQAPRASGNRLPALRREDAYGLSVLFVDYEFDARRKPVCARKKRPNTRNCLRRLKKRSLSRARATIRGFSEEKENGQTTYEVEMIVDGHSKEAARSRCLRYIPVARDGLRMVAIGGALGVASALAVSKMLKAMLFEVSTYDPLTFIAVPVLLTLVALVAILMPARAGIRVDPAVTLCAE
jgi:hypothetical protein